MREKDKAFQKFTIGDNPKIISKRRNLTFTYILPLVLSLAACGGGSESTSSSPVITVQPFTNVVATPPAPPVVINPTVTLTTPLSVLQNGVDHYKSGMYSVINNVWGLQDKKLVANVDYYQKVTYNPNNLQQGVKFEWDFPQNLQDERGSIVYAYPSIAWGNPLPLTGWENQAASLAQIKNIKTFTQTFSINLTGETQYASILHDMWIFDSNGKVAGEIAFFSSPNDWTLYWTNPKNYFGKIEGAKVHTMNLDGVEYNILVTRMHSPNQPQHDKPAYMITPANGKHINKGIINWKQVLDFLVEKGDLNGDHYIRGVEMGAEVHMGDATMVIENFIVYLTAIDPLTQNLITFG